MKGKKETGEMKEEYDMSEDEEKDKQEEYQKKGKVDEERYRMMGEKRNCRRNMRGKTK